MTYSQKVLMRIVRLGSLLFFLFLLLASVLPTFWQDSNSPAPPAAPDSATVSQVPSSSPPASPSSFNDVLDRVIERERLFLAQMRHMRPMVETYLQDLKSDSDGNSIPAKDEYFLGRLEMKQGPEDVSFVG